MTLRTIILLLVAVSAAALTGLYTRNWLNAERAAMAGNRSVAAAVAAPVDVVKVLVATEDLAPGAFVGPEQLRWQPWPAEGIAAGYLTEGKARPEDFIGAVARSRINAGEPISAGRVVHPGDKGFLAAVLEPGKRAVSVPVNATTGIAGFVFPGDRVDVILTARLRVNEGEAEGASASTRQFSRTLLADVRILAIDQRVDNGDGKASKASIGQTATIEVEPKQVEMVALALQMGSLSLSLQSLTRAGSNDGQPAKPRAPRPTNSVTTGADVTLMRASSPPPGKAPAGARTPARQVTVFRGSKAEAAKF